MSEEPIAAHTPNQGTVDTFRTMVGAVVRLVCLTCSVCAVTAILVQDHTHWLSLGVFNTGKHSYRLISDVTLALTVLVAAAFALELARGSLNALARLGRRAIGSFVILELLLYLLDLGCVSRSPTSRLGGPYFELRSPNGEWVILRKHTAATRWYTTTSMFSFRFPQLSTLHSRTPRVLFLGDSYTEGSGSHLLCNYPSVAQRALARSLGRGVEVMNAGVGGYGPADAARLLRYLDAKGFAFDAIVFNLYLGNDFTDNLPGTERRIVAGMLFRFPSSWFLRIFHPLNSRAFRYALYVKAVASSSAHDTPRQDAGPAVVGDVGGFSEPFLAEMEEKLEENYSIDGPGVATGVVRSAIEAMRADAQRLGIPFVVVVFPDRIEASRRLQAALDIGQHPQSYDLSRHQRWISTALRAIPTIQTTALLSGQGALYLRDDIHLSDVGNVRAGEFVGASLSKLLGPLEPFRASARSEEPGVPQPDGGSDKCSEPSPTR